MQVSTSLILNNCRRWDFNTNPKKFIEILADNKEKNTDEIIKILSGYTKTKSLPIDSIIIGSDLNNTTKQQLSQYALLSTRKGENYYVN